MLSSLPTFFQPKTPWWPSHRLRIKNVCIAKFLNNIPSWTNWLQIWSLGTVVSGEWFPKYIRLHEKAISQLMKWFRPQWLQFVVPASDWFFILRNRFSSTATHGASWDDATQHSYFIYKRGKSTIFHFLHPHIHILVSSSIVSVYFLIQPSPFSLISTSIGAVLCCLYLHLCFNSVAAVLLLLLFLFFASR